MQLPGKLPGSATARELTHERSGLLGYASSDSRTYCGEVGEPKRTADLDSFSDASVLSNLPFEGQCLERCTYELQYGKVGGGLRAWLSVMSLSGSCLRANTFVELLAMPTSGPPCVAHLDSSWPSWASACPPWEGRGPTQQRLTPVLLKPRRNWTWTCLRHASPGGGCCGRGELG